MRTTESPTAGPAFRRRSEKTFGPVQTWRSSYPAHGGAGTRSGRRRVAPGLAPCTTSLLPFAPGDDGSASSVRHKAMTGAAPSGTSGSTSAHSRRTNADCRTSWKARRSPPHSACSSTPDLRVSSRPPAVTCGPPPLARRARAVALSQRREGRITSALAENAHPKWPSPPTAAVHLRLAENAAVVGVMR